MGNWIYSSLLQNNHERQEGETDDSGDEVQDFVSKSTIISQPDTGTPPSINEKRQVKYLLSCLALVCG